MVKKTNARGQNIYYTYDLRTGAVLTETVGGVRSFTNTYDALGKLTRTDVFTGATPDTTTYTYDAHDRLATVNGPWLASTVAFTYDGFGRMTRRTVNKVAHSFAYDVLSRLTSETSALGKITYAYETPTNGRLVQVAYPNKMRMKLSYHPASQGKRLKEIRYDRANNNSLISRYEYEYSPAGSITKWTHERHQPMAMKHWSRVAHFGYDRTNQLTSALETQNNGTVNEYGYLYDLAGNRTQEQINGVNTRSVYNRLNQLETYNATGEGGKMRFTGSTTDESWVTVAGVAAKKLPGNRFEAWVNMKQGENTIPIAAMTPDKVIHTENYKVNVPATTPQTLTYDADGNLYEWHGKTRRS
jgi:YD repeat-containing protein